MNTKNHKKLFGILLILILVIAIAWYIIKNVRIEKVEEPIAIEGEYIPEQEIEENTTRQTQVTVYYPDKETGKITPEAKTVDVKEIVDNPYKKVVELLMQGPVNEKLDNVIPMDTTLLDCKLENGNVTVNFSEQIQSANIEKVTEAITKTLTELAEVDSVQILVNGNKI